MYRCCSRRNPVISIIAQNETLLLHSQPQPIHYTLLEILPVYYAHHGVEYIHTTINIIITTKSLNNWARLARKARRLGFKRSCYNNLGQLLRQIEHIGLRRRGPPPDPAVIRPYCLPRTSPFTRPDWFPPDSWALFGSVERRAIAEFHHPPGGRRVPGGWVTSSGTVHINLVRPDWCPPEDWDRLDQVERGQVLALDISIIRRWLVGLHRSPSPTRIGR